MGRCYGLQHLGRREDNGNVGHLRDYLDINVVVADNMVLGLHIHGHKDENCANALRQ